MKRLLFACAISLAPVAGRAADVVAAKEPVTKLSPFEVRANSVEFKHWIKVGSPNFIVYTDATESDASAVLRECEMLHAAGQQFFGRKAAWLGPTILVLPTASSDWRKIETKDGIEWKAAVSMVGSGITDLIVVQTDWQDSGTWIMRSALAAADRERMDIEGPFWFERGLGMFYETAEFDHDKVALGRVNPRSRNLSRDNWLPWGRFFEVKPTSPEFVKEKLIGRYDAQSCIFVQYLFTNPDRTWLTRLTSWLDYLRAGHAPTEEQFKTIFGQDWETWQQTLKTYMSGGAYNVYEMKVPPEALHYTETKFNLPVKEMRELFVLTQILSQSVPESQSALDALLAKGLQTEALRELLVAACRRWKRGDAALESIRTLIAAGTTNPRIYRAGDAILTSHAGPLTLDMRYGNELREVRAWDRRGLELEPLYTELSNSFAANEAFASEVDQQSITTIEECYGRIKGRAPTDEIVAVLAVALWRIGDTPTARALGTKLKDDPLAAKRYRTLAGQLIERIDKEAKAPAPSEKTPASH